MAAEMGHVRVVPRTANDAGAAVRAAWSSYASGNALVRYARARAAAQPGDAVRLLELAGGAVDGDQRAVGDQGRPRG